MAYEMLGSSSISALRAACDPFDLPANGSNNNGYNSFNNNTNNFNGNNNGANNGAGNFPFKPLAASFNPAPSPIRPHLSIAEQAELEFELRYRGNMIVDQQRKIQQLEEELKRARDQMDMMNTQLNTYEQERLKEKKKPQSRYWTPDEHQRFLEALAKYGHKDVKAISMHVSTRNATQVRTHAQKYFLRLERERRKKEDNRDDGDLSSGDDYGSDSGSPMEELSPPTSIASPPQPALLQSQPLQQPAQSGSANNTPQSRRRRSGSLITPTMSKAAMQHQTSVLGELPSWSAEEFEQFVKGLNTLPEKQEDITSACRVIRDGFLTHRTVEDVESCYRTLHKSIKQKPAPLTITPVGSPKRRRTSKPELPINMPMISEGPLPAMGSMPPIMNSNGNNNSSSNSSSNNAPFASFMSGMPTSGAPLPPPPQYMNTNSFSNTGSSTGNSNSNNTLLPFQPPLGVMNMNLNMNMNMRPLLDYGAMQNMQISGGMGMGNMNMMDVGSPNISNTSSQSSWNNIALSFDLHQNTPSSLSSLPHGAPLVSSLN